MTGQSGEYRWLEGEQSDFRRFLKACPQVFLEKSVVITSFDSGPLQANEEELKKGWLQVGDFVVVPQLKKIEDLPWDQDDEWFVFSSQTEPKMPKDFESFVNGGFTLRNSSEIEAAAIASTGAQADLVGARYFAREQADLQMHFWYQIDQIRPESYIGRGYHFIFATRDKVLYDSVLNALSC